MSNQRFMIVFMARSGVLISMAAADPQYAFTCANAVLTVALSSIGCKGASPTLSACPSNTMISRISPSQLEGRLIGGRGQDPPERQTDSLVPSLPVGWGRRFAPETLASSVLHDPHIDEGHAGQTRCCRDLWQNARSVEPVITVGADVPLEARTHSTYSVTDSRVCLSRFAKRRRLI